MTNNLQLENMQTLAEGLPWFGGIAGIIGFFIWMIVWGMVIGGSIGTAVVFGWLIWSMRWVIVTMGGIVLLLIAISTMF